MADNRIFNIYETEFSVSQPFDAGHVCTGPEAKALNQLRKENLSNNFRSTVKEAMDKAAADGSPLDTTALQAAFAELDAKYEFTEASVAASRKLDPVEREARGLVRQELRSKLSENGKLTIKGVDYTKMGDIPEDVLEAIIDKNASSDAIVKMAKAIVKQKQNASGLDLDLAGDTAEQATA